MVTNAISALKNIQIVFFFKLYLLTLSSDGIMERCDNLTRTQRPRCDVSCNNATGRRTPATVTHSQSNPSTLNSSQCLKNEQNISICEMNINSMGSYVAFSLN